MSRRFLASMTTTVMVMAGAALTKAEPVGTAFTYQGKLELNGAPVDDSSPGCDLSFSLWDHASSVNPVNQIGDTQTLTGVPVESGVFTVELGAGGEFGPDAFDGEQRWLEIAVRCPSGIGGYTTLSPRQPITATPYALFALDAPAAGGPWNVSGANIYYNAGNVGIGTATPAQPLHLVRSTIPPLAMQMSSDWAPPVVMTRFPAAGQNLGQGGSPWSSPGEATTNNGLSSQVYLDPSGFSDVLFVSGFGYALPVNAVVHGIRVDIEYTGTGEALPFENEVSLAGGSTASQNKSTGAILPDNSFVARSFGGPTDKWGVDWTPAQINAASFGVRFRLTSFAGSQAEGLVDYINVTVYYTDPTQSTTTNWTLGIDYLTDLAFAPNGNLSNPLFRATTTNDMLFTGGGVGFVGASSPFPSGRGVFIEGGGLAQVFAYDYNTNTHLPLLLNGTAGSYVGIGTASPNYPLTLNTPFGSYGFAQTAGSVTLATYCGGAANGGWIGTVSAHPLYLYTNNAQPSLAVAVNGNVGIGTNTPAQKLQVIGNMCATGTIGGCSDGRMKHRIEPLRDALAIVEKLRPVRFDWKRNEFPAWRFTDERQIGLVAQQVEQVAPEVVQRGSDGYLSVDYGRLTPILVEAIQEMSDQIQRGHHRIAEKDAQIAAQQSRIDDLTARLERLESAIAELAPSKENRK